jgi:hypothetical protein
MTHMLNADDVNKLQQHVHQHSNHFSWVKNKGNSV